MEATGEIWARSRLRAAAGDVWVRIHHDFPCEAVTVLSLIERSRHSGTIATMPRRHCNMSYLLACFVGYTGYTPVPAGPKCESRNEEFFWHVGLAGVGLCRAACPSDSAPAPGSAEIADGRPEMAHERLRFNAAVRPTLCPHMLTTHAGTSADRDALPARARPPSAATRGMRLGSAQAGSRS